MLNESTEQTGTQSMTTHVSSADAFLHQIVTAADPIAFLRNLVDPSTGMQEEDWLEFKGGTDVQTGRPLADSECDRLWSKALSGFANTGGGLLICGIDARRDANGIDRASSLNLIKNPAAFKTRLNQLSQHATDPPVTGFEIVEFTDTTQNGEGFVVCLIPESSFKPHRAKKCCNTSPKASVLPR